MQLRFPAEQVSDWASRYSYPRPDGYLSSVIAPTVQRQGFYTKPQLLEVCRWKSPRSAPNAEDNDESLVKEVTGIALSTHNERLRIEVLTLLAGVGWPVASTLLHFVRPEYPILDVRALWSLGRTVAQHQHNFALWSEYVSTCQRTAAAQGVSLRTLDKALWQYSKENQPNLTDDDG